MELSDALKAKLASIKAVIFDGDGVLFTGSEHLDGKGDTFKVRSFIDGQGISLMRAAGVHVAIATGEKSNHVDALVEKYNTLPSVQNGDWSEVTLFKGVQGNDKVIAAEEWLSVQGVGWEACGAMGDDLSDIALLRKVGFAAAPVQAEAIVKKRVDWVSERSGGSGAVRDFANIILEAKNIDPLDLTLC